MKHIFVEESHTITAAPEALHSIIADYNVGHQAILPRPSFEEMIVEQGGFGAGTVLRLRMKVMGQTYHYHQRVTEPEPGRVLVETDIDTGEESRFILEPLANGRTRITIRSKFNQKPGIVGFLQRMFQPGITRKLYYQELRNLESVVHNRDTSPAGVAVG